MLEFYGRKFTCDECPICEGIEHRVRVAREGGYEPQLEYCGCDKVQTEFFISGYCSDAFEADKPQGKLCEPRKTGRAYRRKMRKQKKEKLMRIMTYGYKSGIGYTDWGWKDGVYQPVGSYIQYPKNSNRQTFLRRKNMSCYKDGGCGIYEMYSCYECPASKPEYLKRKSREPQRLQAIGNLHDVAKQILDDEVVILLRQYGTTLAPGRMGDESRVPKWLLVLAADRIEELKNARTKQ